MKPYYRDIWCLGSGSGYPGAFPRGLMPRILQKWNGEKKIMLFSGSFHDRGWETLDVKPEMNPTYSMDAESLPEDWTEKYDLVMADPPYSEAEAKDLYDLPYFNIAKVINEMARITRGGGNNDHVASTHSSKPFHRHIPFQADADSGSSGCFYNSRLQQHKGINSMEKTGGIR